jgi:hypothetical protein
MTGMPTRKDQIPPRQQDDAPPAQDARRPSRDEVRSFATNRALDDGIDDIGEWMDYPDINTHGSER